MDSLLQVTLEAVRGLRARALAFEREHAREIAHVDPRRIDSARNLLHYLSLRQQDIRELQRTLHALGLSSFGALESHVLASLEVTIGNLEVLSGRTPADATPRHRDLSDGPRTLRRHACDLLGQEPAGRPVRIMVTMPSEAADDESLIAELLRAGMDVMRINCAHDGPPAWRRMAENLRRAERSTGRRCLIQVDLAGPKLRTGPIAPIGRFVRIRPVRDPMGCTLAPGIVMLAPESAPVAVPRGAVRLPVPPALLERAAAGDVLRVRDLRGRLRSLTLVRRDGAAWVAEATRAAYVGQGAACALLRGDAIMFEATVGALPEVVLPIVLQEGDRLCLTREAVPGVPAVAGTDGRAGTEARIHCTLAAAFDRVRNGHAAWLDDGRIGGVVESCDGATIGIRITRVPPGGARLSAEKGINFPDTDLGLDALTAADLLSLRETVAFADLVALSFLRGPRDVETLQRVLQELGAGHLGTVLKIENATAFRNLPGILLASLRLPRVGVMVARGDLAVEVGFERLSEVQEEILWLSEAAHVPVIWATQVLEGLAKAGAPTRAEVSDAAMSSRAECVMLNKGPRIVETVRFLSDVLARMAAHHDKRTTLLRRLSVSMLASDGAADEDDCATPFPPTPTPTGE